MAAISSKHPVAGADVLDYLWAMEKPPVIDHDPNEHRKFPDYGDRKWAKDKFGDPKPSDLFYYILPYAAVAIALLIWRGY